MCRIFNFNNGKEMVTKTDKLWSINDKFQFEMYGTIDDFTPDVLVDIFNTLTKMGLSDITKFKLIRNILVNGAKE